MASGIVPGDLKTSVQLLGYGNPGERIVLNLHPGVVWGVPRIAKSTNYKGWILLDAYHSATTFGRIVSASQCYEREL